MGILHNIYLNKAFSIRSIYLIEKVDSKCPQNINWPKLVSDMFGRKLFCNYVILKDLFILSVLYMEGKILF